MFGHRQLRIQSLMVAAATVSILCALPATASAANCTMVANKRAVDAPAIEPSVTLSLESQSDAVINFGEDRGVKVNYVTIKVSPRLPDNIRSKNLELNSLLPMKRIGTDNLESTRLKFPRFIPPRILSHGERISFGICIDAADGDPGTYTGQVELNGPLGLSPLQLTQTAQLKAKVFGLFGIFFIIALGLAGIFVWRKVGKETSATGGKKLGAQIAVVAISLGAAGYAMWKVYNESPSWGADWFSSLAALVATGFAAGGIGTGVSALAGLITGKETKAPEARENPAPAKPPG